MKAVKEMLNGFRVPDGPAPTITVCWLEDGASLALWPPRLGHGRICKATAGLAPADCTAGRYTEAIGALARACPGRAPEIRWVVAPELAGPSGPAIDGAYPEWMRACWAELAQPAMPRLVLSGLRVMESQLLDWPPFREPGTGVCVALAGRLVVFGRADGPGSFIRIGRQAPDAGARDGVPDPDWLRQTRLLYRNRTGGELLRLHLPGEPDESRAHTLDGMEVLPGGHPPAWTPRACAPLAPGLLFLHASAVRAQATAGAQQPIALLEKKRRNWRLERHLRLAACLLLGSWMFLLLAACRHQEQQQPGDAAANRAWRDAHQQWEDEDRRWRGAEQGRIRTEAPYQLVGAVAGSVPAGVSLRRIQIRRIATGDDVSVQLEGVYAGDEPAPVFREWIEQLKGASPLAQVENLRFRREEGRVVFTLQGTTRGEGGVR